jgi:hypothetical protein
MAAVALAVAQREFAFEDWHFTFNLTAGITTADIGKAVSMGAADMTVKLCGDGEKILGRLETVEDRTQVGEGLVGTVAIKFFGKLPSSGAIARGASVVGSATPGSVKAATTFTATGQAGDLPSYANIALSAAASNVVNVLFGI